MKPLVLTVEEEAIIRRDMDMFGHLQQRRLCAEIDALRRLPVIAACADCRHQAAPAGVAWAECFLLRELVDPAAMPPRTVPAARRAMKPLKMTEECEAEVRAMAAIFAPEADASTLRVALVVSVAEIDALRAELDRCTEHLRSSVEDEEALVGEIDTLHRLPVIPTCGDCAHAEDDCTQAERVCTHPDAVPQGSVWRDEAPPDWCPLRGGAR